MSTASRRKSLLRDIATSARRFPSPENYFSGLRWHRGYLPDNVLCFHRSHPVHDLTGHEGISEKSGKYDQHDQIVLILCPRQDGAAQDDRRLRAPLSRPRTPVVGIRRHPPPSQALSRSPPSA